MFSPVVVGREKSLMETLSLRRGSPVSPVTEGELFWDLLAVQENRRKSAAIKNANLKK